jgi:hypothetical protein
MAKEKNAEADKTIIISKKRERRPIDFLFTDIMVKEVEWEKPGNGMTPFHLSLFVHFTKRTKKEPKKTKKERKKEKEKKICLLVCWTFWVHICGALNNSLQTKMTEEEIASLSGVFFSLEHSSSTFIFRIHHKVIAERLNLRPEKRFADDNSTDMYNKLICKLLDL